MNDHAPDQADEAAASAPAVPLDTGAALRCARTRLSMSVEEVSNRIKFAPQQIEALEAGDFAHLPEAAFLRGFIRSYAKLLQIDAAPLIAALPQKAEPSVPLEAQALPDTAFPNIYAERRHNFIWLVVALAIALALALAAWVLGGAGSPGKQAAPPSAAPATATPQTATDTLTLTPPEATPVSAIPDTAQAAAPTVAAASAATAASASGVAAAPDLIRMTFDQDSWVEITDKKGNILISQLNRSGTQQSLNGTPPLALVIGHGKSVHLYYKGQAVDLAPYIKTDVARLTLE
jgi:cytoskeleton protein RodZ